MRLDFHVVVIDDDFYDDKKSRSVNSLLTRLERHIEKKGFTPKFFKYLSMDSCLNDDSLCGEKHLNRIDLYLSDNNLQGANQDGIDLYLKLKDIKLTCDFVLYTRSDIDEIVSKLSKDLNEKKDPNLFTRFTFVARPAEPSEQDWHNPILLTIDHIITKREEINHLRGLFAQVTAKIHNKLKELIGNSKLDFESSINQAKDNGIIDQRLKDWLHTQRLRRNAIIHNDEIYDSNKKTFCIRCEEKHNIQTYTDADFPMLRERLKSTKEIFFEQISGQ